MNEENRPFTITERQLTEQKYSPEKQRKEFATHLDIAQYGVDVHSRVKDDITADYIFMKGDSKDKEFIIEMVGNAYYMQEILERVKHRIPREGFDRMFYGNTSYKEYLKAIEYHANTLFDGYMIKVNMIAILNRNKRENPILEMFFGFSSKPEDEMQTDGGFLSKFRNLLGGEKNNEPQQDI